MPLNLYQERRPKKVLAIAAGKGGVGKSTVTVHLALALKERGLRVGILDADLYGPSIRKMLAEEELPEQVEGKLKPAKAWGISLMSMGFFRQEHEAAVIRAPLANRLIAQFLNQVAWGDLDWLLIDFPPGTGDIPLTIAQQGNLFGALMVTTPQEVALSDVRKAMRMFAQVHVPVIGIVENMTGVGDFAPFGRGGGSRLAEETKVPLLGEVPLDAQICAVADVGRSGLLRHQAFASIAEKLS